MASCIITGNIYQYMLNTNPSDTPHNVPTFTNYPNHDVYSSASQLETKANLTTTPPPKPTVAELSHDAFASESLSLLSKYYPANVLNKNIYSAADFSFFWVQGDGSPLYINASKYNTMDGYKSFVFCPIPKVGCSSWKQVIKRIKGSPVYLADDYWSLHDPKENELDEDRIHRFGVDRANQLLLNRTEELFHAAFVRDPIARALSAFLDKCINAFWIGKEWCTPSSNARNNPLSGTTEIPQGTYSHFDLFIENIINKPMLPNKREPVYHEIWMSDFHWLPQSFICDIYKFIDRYHIYHAENRWHRKQFLIDIGGEKLWKKIGSYGWITRGKKKVDYKLQLHYGTDKHREAKTVHAKEYFGAVFKYYNKTTHSWRRHPPSINTWTMISDVNVSLLDSQTFHQSNAQSRLLQYYRSDLLAKAMVYYEVDYMLFNKTIPNIVCNYLQYDALRQLMKSIVNYAGSGSVKVNVELEKTFRMKANDIFNGYYSVYEPRSKHKGYKSIYVNRNGTNTSIWNRDKYTFHSNLDTKIPHFYHMMEFDDAYKDKIFGIRLSGVRGMVTLINVMSIIDPKTWPANDKCFNLKKYGWSLKHTVRKELHEMMDIVNKYFVHMLPMIMKTLSKEKARYVGEQIRIWTQQTSSDFAKLNIPKLIAKWIEEDKALYSNIKSWVLYQRDVPRQMFYQEKHKKADLAKSNLDLYRQKK